MANVSLQNLRKTFGESIAVRDASFDIAQGEFMVLLGPSGCGKTTTLRMLAGFIEPTAGTILIGGRDVTRVPPWLRNTGLVFQSYALFPHMTVAENIAFGLEMRKLPASEIAPRVSEALAMVRLSSYGDRLPRALSGGQQQRVALARSLAIRPDVLLLDEPLSNLDAKLRAEVRVEIRELQQRLGLTTVMVTHDQEEALTMADRLVVMAEGSIRQIGSQRDLYERPANRFVANFVGRSNFLEGDVKDGLFISRSGLPIKQARVTVNNGPATLGIRPERITLEKRTAGAISKPGAQGFHSLAGKVDTVSYLGAALDIHVDLGGGETIIVQMINRGSADAPQAGDDVTVTWPDEAGQVFGAN